MANIIITNLSKLRSDSTDNEYISELDNIKVVGKNTNDAPVKYLIRHITDKGEAVNKIIVVTTPEAKTALEAFKETVKPFFDEKENIENIVDEVDAKDGEFTETINKITKKFSSGDCAYIDTTGGFRNSSYILMCVVRILEYSGIRLKKAVYSFFETKKISDVTHVYGMYDLINAVDAFTNYGNSYGLDRYFRHTEEPVVKEVIDAMNEFSENISLCRTSGLSDILNRLNGSLEKLSETQSDSAGIILFKSLIDTVRDKFYMRGNTIEYPDIIRWCLDNRLIQQAVTIYVERMPEYFYKKGYFTVTAKKLKEIEAEKGNSHFDISYEMFYNSFMQADKNIPVRKLFNAVSNECKKDYEYDKNNKLHVLFRRIGTTSDINKIIDIMPPDIADGKELEKPLKEFIKLRNILYSNGKKKNEADYKGKLSYFPEIEELLKKRKIIFANSTDGFIRSIANDEQFCRLISGIEEPGLKESKLIFIEGLSKGECNDGFALGDNLTAEKMQTILRDLIFAKSFIRNKLNHASDEDTMTEEMQKYFSSYGYNVDSEMSVNEIKEFMLKAIENLKF